MGDVIGLLPITPMESKDNAKGRVYCAHGILRPFMTELEVFHPLSTALTF